ncbi:MAG TPA: hypothetical protein ENI94_08355 [Gammaproteobacteria bacterium]|nr:hypothetical protein [Gammaproteobacteria bacterium]
MTKKKPPDNDNALFRELMSDVKPLAAKPRIIPARTRPVPRPEPRQDSPPEATAFIKRETAPATQAEERLDFTRGGAKRRQLLRLRRGEIPTEARLDLHGHTIAEAGAILHDFLDASHQAGHRCVLIVHGKGHRSDTGQPVLKTQLNHWLRDEPRVLAFHSAQPCHGGAGALYVLLRRCR